MTVLDTTNIAGAADSLKPRCYQIGAIDAIQGRFAAGDSRTLLVIPTGGGKTIVAAHVAREMLSRGRVMVICHRDELVRQAVEKFAAVTGLVPAVEKAGEYSDEESLQGKPQVVVSSVQTLNSGTEQLRRFHRFSPMEFSFLWVDEAHHAPASTWTRVIDYFTSGNPALKVLGVTATPDRADGEALGQVFQSVAFCYSLPDAIHDGYLVPVRQNAVIIEGLDLSLCRNVANDLNAGDLERAVLLEKPLHGVCHATIEVACGVERHWLAEIRDRPDRLAVLKAALEGKPRRRTLIFCVSVAHAQKTAEILNRWIAGSAEAIDGGTPREKRRKILEKFASGETQFLVNCQVASEGFDSPGIELVVMARPTKSRALYAQMAGRGTRPAGAIAAILGDVAEAAARVDLIRNSAKPFVEILDFVGNAGRHKLVSAADILGDGRSEEVIERAREIAEEGAIDLDEAFAQAELEEEARQEARQMRAEAEYEKLLEEEEARRQEALARRAGLVGTAIYHLKQVSSVGPDSADSAGGGAASSAVLSTAPKRGGATEKQIAFLQKLGVRPETAAGYSLRQASAVIADLKEKTCTAGQRWKLRTLGYGDAEIEGMNFARASEAIDAATRETAGVA